jgi:hypothetical protein
METIRLLETSRLERCGRTVYTEGRTTGPPLCVVKLEPIGVAMGLSMLHGGKFRCGAALYQTYCRSASGTPVTLTRGHTRRSALSKCSNILLREQCHFYREAMIAAL